MNIPNKNEVLSLVEKYATNTKQHLLQVGDIMQHFAKKLEEDEHYWWTVGVLHDIDWDYIGKDSDKHLKEDLEKIVSEINLPEEIIGDIRSHGYFFDDIEEIPDTLVRQYLLSIDELSGFIWAYFRMIPSNNIMDIKTQSIDKKLKDKSFAAGVSRKEARACEELLEISLNDFIEDIKLALNGKGYIKNQV